MSKRVDERPTPREEEEEKSPRRGHKPGGFVSDGVEVTHRVPKAGGVVKNWLVEYWPGVVFCAAVVGLVVVLFAVVHPLAQREQEIERQRQDCIDVLRCVDLGVERQRCDELFPKCQELKGS